MNGIVIRIIEIQDYMKQYLHLLEQYLLEQYFTIRPIIILTICLLLKTIT